MATQTYTKSGNKATTAVKLNKDIYSVKVQDHALLKQAYTAYLANGRENLAVTKTRGLVRGGGKKPWKQKGTGRARFGSSRVPIWRGGGITFGPTGEENYTHKLTTTAKRTAVRQALSLANDAGKLHIIESLDFKGKTAEVPKLLTKIGVTRKVLVVVAEKTPEITRPIANLQDVSVITARYLSVFEILNADNMVITADAVKAIDKWLTVSGGDK